MKSLSEIKNIVENITYKERWTLEVYLDGNRPYLQILFKDNDAETGLMGEQRCRKWFLSFHMSTTEIVYTAFKAVQAAEKQVTREFFKYNGVRIANQYFSPYSSVDDIVNLVN